MVRLTAPDDETQQILRKQVQVGREELTRAILNEARKAMPDYGIELKDVRIKRINYIPSVQKRESHTYTWNGLRLLPLSS